MWKDGNKKFSIKDKYALLLGLELNKSKSYRLSTEKQIEYYRLKANDGILTACENVGVVPEVTPMLWLKTKHESVQDSVLDLANYAILLSMILKDKSNG